MSSSECPLCTRSVIDVVETDFGALHVHRVDKNGGITAIHGCEVAQ